MHTEASSAAFDAKKISNKKIKSFNLLSIFPGTINTGKRKTA